MQSMPVSCPCARPFHAHGSPTTETRLCWWYAFCADDAPSDSVPAHAQGWFNLHESNMETYEFSKLKKFLTLLRFHMEVGAQGGMVGLGG